tara:strand:+ start:1572 stop:1826 length:255 start_codon:yes stop_codon:yes gene_type:complete
MSSKGLDKSAASVKAKSNVLAEKIWQGRSSTVIRMSKQELRRFARNMIMLAEDDEVEGPFTITAHVKPKRVGVLGRKIKSKRGK